MQLITREEILKLAKSANLSITEQEIPVLLKRLEDVLGYASYLKDIAAAHEGELIISMKNITREDLVKPSQVEPLLALAPEREENFFVVPAILKRQADNE